MIYWFFSDYFAARDLTVRIALSGILSFILVMVLGAPVIRWLGRKKAEGSLEFGHAQLNEAMSEKSPTPTMGGLLIIAAIFISTLLFANLSNMYIRGGLLALVWLGVVGGWDDWLKLRHPTGSSKRDGLKSWEKAIFQVGLCVLLGVFIYRTEAQNYILQDTGEYINPAHSFFLPMFDAPIALSLLAYVFIMALVMTGTSNAVNLTDGMDGLATGCLLIVTGFFLIIAWIVGVEAWAQIFTLPFVPSSAEMTILCSSMLGALLGFLWFNASPAAVYMGDTGSLPLGGIVGYIAVVTRQEFILCIAGGVFVMEAASVIIQILYSKATKQSGASRGKYFFRCAPIHYHFHLGGWPRTKVVVRFWILGIIFAVLAIGILKAW